MTSPVVNHTTLVGAGPWTVPSTTAGNVLLIVGYMFTGLSSVPTFSIGGVDFTPSLAGVQEENSYLLLNCPGAQTSLSVSWSNGAPGQYAFKYIELDGLLASPYLTVANNSQSAPGTGAGRITSGPITLSAAQTPAIIVGGNWDVSNSSTTIVPVGTLLDGPTSGDGGASSYVLATSPGTYQIAATDTTHGSVDTYDSTAIALLLAPITSTSYGRRQPIPPGPARRSGMGASVGAGPFTNFLLRDTRLAQPQQGSASTASRSSSANVGTSDIITGIALVSSGRAKCSGSSAPTTSIPFASRGGAKSSAYGEFGAALLLASEGASHNASDSTITTRIALASSGYARSRGTSAPTTGVALRSHGHSKNAAISSPATEIALRSTGSSVQITGSTPFTGITLKSSGLAFSTGTTDLRFKVTFTTSGSARSSGRSAPATAITLDSKAKSVSTAIGRAQFGAALTSRGTSRSSGGSAPYTGIALQSGGRSVNASILVQTFPARFGYAVVTPLSQSGVQAAEQAYVEGSTVYVEVAYFDSTGAPFTPNVVTYNVTDVNSGTSLVSSTQVIPAESEIITIKGAQNYMVSLTRASEQHAIVVAVTDGFGNTGYGQATFDVVRAPGT